MLPQADHLSDVFRRHCADCRWTPLHLPSSGAASEEQLLQELIACREGGNAALSLALIQLAEHHGWTSPWLDDNKARAELALGRPEKACAIWETLTSAADESAAAIATASLNQLRRKLRLQNVLIACCRTSGWQPRHLGNPAEASDIGLGQALSEIGACRQSGRPNLSLNLIALCRRFGETSPWLEDNQARLEVEQGRFWSAAERWRQLQGDPDPEAAAMGAAMIHMLEEKFQELGFQPSWLNLSHAAGQEAFIAVLNEALHQQRSSHAAFTHRLLQLAQEQGWLKNLHRCQPLPGTRSTGCGNRWNSIQTRPFRPRGAMASANTANKQQRRCTAAGSADRLLPRSRMEAAASRCCRQPGQHRTRSSPAGNH